MKLKQSEGLIKRLPGFGSGQWWKSLLASGGYLIIFFICIGLLLPTTPSLALEFVDPTNKDSVSISGKTNADKSVTLIQEGGVIDSINADSSGQFYFVLNNLPEGSFSYQIEVCNSGKKRQCVTKSLLIEIDKTSPNMPLIALPNQLPEIAGDEAIFKGKAEPGSIITVQIGSQQIEGIKADESGEFEIKTGLDLGVNTIKIQAIDKVGNKSETYSSEVEYNPVKQKVKVTRIIDGDTIEIQTGEKIRYIGVNTPETNECYFNQAKDKNTSLVKDKEVILEKDVSETDRYQRLLRYVWLDGQLINEVLVKEGYAQAATYPPDVKYQARFLEAQAWAREQTRGLWGEVCNPNQKSSNDSQVQGV
ncbi:MAG: thermonuclease family protein, partial [Patescibacteria group bacterium]